MRGMLEKILESEGVPKQLLAVVLVESAAQPFALSKRQARGLWQFMTETAHQYGLQVGADRDDRVDMERASRAAGWYLRQLYRRFGNWPLALAAYNAGPEAVQRALARSKANMFWQLSAGRQLPAETGKYVPKVLAAAKLFNLSPLEQNGLFHSPTVWIYALSARPNDGA
jgi:membrane-bound lytic murein transglycosylase D